MTNQLIYITLIWSSGGVIGYFLGKFYQNVIKKPEPSN